MRIDDVVAESLEKFERSNADFKKEGVNVAGDEESNAHLSLLGVGANLVRHADEAHPHDGGPNATSRGNCIGGIPRIPPDCRRRRASAAHLTVITRAAWLLSPQSCGPDSGRLRARSRLEVVSHLHRRSS